MGEHRTGFQETEVLVPVQPVIVKRLWSGHFSEEIGCVQGGMAVD